MQGKRVLVINRWPDDFADYDKSIDHKNNLVGYIVDKAGRGGIFTDLELIAELFVVDSLDDVDELHRCALEFQDRFGAIDQIMALSEFDLIQAAKLRTRLGVPGIQEHQVLLYKDKVEMKKRMRERSLRVPNFADCMSIEQVAGFAETCGYPIILKPKSGAASQGVHLIERKEQLEAVFQHLVPDEYECEEYVRGSIYHVDGLVNDGTVEFIKASKYINTCLQFNHGVPLGSFTVEEPLLRDTLIAFTKQTLEALELTTSAFHLEIIMKDEAEPVFLEIGARVGGGEIQFVTKDVYGVSLVDEWIKIIVGSFAGLVEQDQQLHSGFLMIPEPQDVPCVVVEAPSMVEQIPTLYREILPTKGTVLDGNGGYIDIAGRFMYRGNSAAEIERDILRTMELYQLKTSTVVRA